MPSEAQQVYEKLKARAAERQQVRRFTIDCGMGDNRGPKSSCHRVNYDNCKQVVDNDLTIGQGADSQGHRDSKIISQSAGFDNGRHGRNNKGPPSQHQKMQDTALVH